MIKCVVWDLDRTLVEGVLLESDDALTVRDGVSDTLRQLHERGIINSIASRNPQGPASQAVETLNLPVPLVSPQYGWGAKSDSIRRIAEDLGCRLDTVAFVDDDPYERAEVSAALPQVLVLSPDDIADALQWPRFNPATVTPEARRRADSYLRAQERDRESHEFTGSREDFRRYIGTEVTIRFAGTHDRARLAELSRRTSRFNSRGMARTETEFATYLTDDGHNVVCVELRDRFADEGTIGGLVVSTGPVWEADLLMMSCRAMGRGVIEVLLAWLVGAAKRAAATTVRLPLRVNERNLPLRLALVSAGFRARAGSGEEAMFERDVSDVGSELPDWVKVEARS